MKRDIRYQGAIVRDHHLLLIRHQDHDGGRSYWLLPGGGREGTETEEACVAREMSEETGLAVTVERLLMEETELGGIYQRRRTYLCSADRGEAKPGYEPEVEASEVYGIVEVRWFDLRDAATWDPLAVADAITYPQMRRIQAALGYAESQAAQPKPDR
jgi:8-oxo-dGTP pyrophosphatase MutT (NUDIX family)